MKEMPDLACWLSPLFFYYWNLFFKVYYREDDEE